MSDIKSRSKEPYQKILSEVTTDTHIHLEFEISLSLPHSLSLSLSLSLVSDKEFHDRAA